MQKIACKKYKGIIFTEKDGNITIDNNNPDSNQKKTET